MNQQKTFYPATYEKRVSSFPGEQISYHPEKDEGEGKLETLWTFSKAGEDGAWLQRTQQASVDGGLPYPD